jgi:hypothetical protein
LIYKSILESIADLSWSLIWHYWKSYINIQKVVWNAVALWWRHLTTIENYHIAWSTIINNLKVRSPKLINHQWIRCTVANFSSSKWCTWPGRSSWINYAWSLCSIIVLGCCEWAKFCDILILSGCTLVTPNSSSWSCLINASHKSFSLVISCIHLVSPQRCTSSCLRKRALT